MSTNCSSNGPSGGPNVPAPGPSGDTRLQEINRFYINPNDPPELKRLVIYRFVPERGRALCWVGRMDGPRQLAMFDYTTGRELYRVNDFQTGFFTSLSPDGRRMLSLRGIDEIVLSDAVTGKELRAFPKLEWEVYAAEWLPDNRRFIATSRDASARLWDADAPPGQPALLTRFDNGKLGPPGLAVFPDGRRFATCDATGHVTIWDVENASPVRQTERATYPPYTWRDPRGNEKLYEGVSAALWRLAVTPDGRTLVAGAQSGGVFVFDAETGRKLAEHHEADRSQHDVNDVAVSPDGRHVLFCTNKGFARLWNWPDGGRVIDFPMNRAVAEASDVNPHRHGTSGVAFSADGNRAITGGYDGTVRVWKLIE